MKKLFALLLALMMVFALTACGDNNTTDPDKDNPGTSQSGENNDGGEENNGGENNTDEPYSQAAFENYLSSINLELDDIDPDFEWKLNGEKQVFAEDPTQLYAAALIWFTKESGEITNDEYDAYLEKLYAATKAISQDGKNIKGQNFVSDGENPLTERTLEEAKGLMEPVWGFRYNDRYYYVHFGRGYSDSEKESEIGNLYYYDRIEIRIDKL